ncbi:MAG TPA: ferredoxin family protein [Nocardioidaceae bacterium]|nr:ferredoxin family protein [Nocardioidaceae bacterium]
MGYVITAKCGSTKDASCARVCPVGCIHPTPDEPGYGTAAQLYIDPEECIDCDACREACPVDAIYAIGRVPDEFADSVLVNAEYYA